MKEVRNSKFDEERALYGSNEIMVINCAFDGPQDGESALKESSNVEVSNSYFNLRYPFWHNHKLIIKDSEMTGLCRASLWYSDDIIIDNVKMHGIKALRECYDVTIKNSDIDSPEFGWSVNNVKMENTKAVSEYFMMRSANVTFTKVALKGKYSFQYIENGVFEDCNFDTKDSFWHAKNVVVRNSVINGEYLGWYSDGLVLENCTINGTQPLCYCKNLKLVNCTMTNADLCFEKSDVEATINSPLISIKNPSSGHISVPKVDLLIRDEEGSKCEIILTDNK